MNNHPSRRSYAITLFLILLACYGYFLPKWDDIDWVANSRADLVYAMGDRGVLYIDDYHTNTGDKAFFNGHYYSVGSIGPSLVALPFYMIFKGIAALAPLKDFLLSDQVVTHFQNRLMPESAPISLNFGYQNLALTFITFFSISIPSAILGTILFLFTAHFTCKDSYAFTLALIYGLGTVAFPYSKALFQHQIAAFGAFAGFFLLWRVIYDGANLRWLWLVGLLFGLTAISEYPVIPFLGLIFVWAVYKGSIHRQLYRVILGAFPMLLIFIMYNLATFSTLLPISYKYHVIHNEIHRQGLMGITAPSLEALYGLTISPFRGLFVISPVLILAIPGLYLMWRQKYQDVAILLAFIIIGFFLYNISYLFWWGGYAIGPRYLVPMIPFMMIPISLTFNRWFDRLIGRLVIGLLIILSGVNVWAQTIAGQYYPATFSEGVPLNNPLIDYSIPLILAGDIAHNYGNILGLAGLPSLIPLLIVVVGIYLMIHLFTQPSQYQGVNTPRGGSQGVSTRLALTDSFRSQHIVVVLWSLWAVALLVIYYKQLWHLFIVGPSAWVTDN
ncbi:MAG: hypothetical protein HYR94_29830, partial [Chloroflexi bacterium]|nr:hypothetical protein [Chloroflexota bacterium]